MNIIQKIRKRRELGNNIIKNNYRDIEEANYDMLNRLLCIAMCSFLFLLVTSVFEESYYIMRCSYFIMVLAMGLLFLLQRALKQRVKAVFMLYFGYGVLIGIVTYTSAFITRTNVSAIIILCLFQMPVIILDKSRRVNSMEIVFMLVYLTFIINFKDKALVVDECVNVCSTGMMAMILGGYLRKTRLDNFELKRQAIIGENTDELTGLGNRRKLFCRLEDKAAPVSSILIADIDYFKLYNDTYGHQAGDECLRKIGDFFKQISEKYPITFFRYGGEEFVGVSHKLSAEELYAVSKEITKEVVEMQIPNKGAAGSYVSISIGLTGAEKGQDDGYEKMLSRADTALYKAKGSGRNKAVIYDKNSL